MAFKSVSHDEQDWLEYKKEADRRTQEVRRVTGNPKDEVSIPSVLRRAFRFMKAHPFLEKEWEDDHESA